MVTSNSVADRFGIARSFYRIQGVDNSWKLYNGTFAFPEPNKDYKIDFYSVDALTNSEEVQSVYFISHDAPPRVHITFPIRIKYAHSRCTAPHHFANNTHNRLGIVSTLPSFDALPVNRRTLARE